MVCLRGKKIEIHGLLNRWLYHKSLNHYLRKEWQTFNPVTREANFYSNLYTEYSVLDRM